MQDTGRNSNKDSNMDNDMNNNANNNVNEQPLSDDKRLREMYDKLVGYEKTIHEQNQKRIKIGLRCIYIIPLFFLVLLMIVPILRKRRTQALSTDRFFERSHGAVFFIVFYQLHHEIFTGTENLNVFVDKRSKNSLHLS